MNDSSTRSCHSRDVCIRLVDLLVRAINVTATASVAAAGQRHKYFKFSIDPRVTRSCVYGHQSSFPIQHIFLHGNHQQRPMFLFPQLRRRGPSNSVGTSLPIQQAQSSGLFVFFHPLYGCQTPGPFMYGRDYATAALFAMRRR